MVSDVEDIEACIRFLIDDVCFSGMIQHVNSHINKFRFKRANVGCITRYVQPDVLYHRGKSDVADDALRTCRTVAVLSVSVCLWFG